MSEMDKPRNGSRTVARFPDDVDGLLRAYFQSELPRSWSAPPVPATVPDTAGPLGWTATSSRRAFALVRSRWALAASVLALLLGHAFLSHSFPEVTPTDSAQGPGTLIGRQPGSPTRTPTNQRLDDVRSVSPPSPK